ncbi:MAG: CDP-glycerol glycerophosphotransferase family protein [Eubacterium sp.]|nr:CDP-glycerol glycerophosphotransferase family protein [Eubacterium sp.]
MKIKRYAKKAVTMSGDIILNRLFHVLPVKQNKILFLSDVRAQLDGNLAFVRDALPPGYEVVTSLKGDRSERLSFSQWIARNKNLATSRAVFLDDFSDSTAFMHVREGQDLIQLWHGSGAFKKFGYGRAEETGDLKHVHPGYKRYTKAIVSSEEIRPIYARAYGISEDKVYATGVPRTDAFFDEGYRRKKIQGFYEQYPMLREKKIIIFAPTYRGDRVEEAGYAFDKLDLAQMYDSLGDEYAIIFKWHPALYQRMKREHIGLCDLTKYSDFAYDMSEYREVNDLLFVADVLVTDYSSVIFDYALLNKPIVYYTYDLENYAEGRGLYFPFQSYVYGAVANNLEELIDAIKTADVFQGERETFIKRFASANTGEASKRVVELIS